MNEKTLRVPFNAPLNEQDTETQTLGCRQNNPDICGNNGLSGVCASFVKMESVENHPELGRSSIRSSKAKPLNYCLSFHSLQFYRQSLQGQKRSFFVQRTEQEP